MWTINRFSYVGRPTNWLKLDKRNSMCNRLFLWHRCVHSQIVFHYNFKIKFTNKHETYRQKVVRTPLWLEVTFCCLKEFLTFEETFLTFQVILRYGSLIFRVLMGMGCTQNFRYWNEIVIGCTVSGIFLGFDRNAAFHCGISDNLYFRIWIFLYWGGGGGKMDVLKRKCSCFNGKGQQKIF